MIIYIGIMFGYIGSLIGYIIGLKIWDYYYEKIIVPKEEKLERQRRMEVFEICKVIGNPNIVKIPVI